VVVTACVISLVTNFKEERSRKERLPAFFAMSASPFLCNEIFISCLVSHASCNSSSSYFFLLFFFLFFSSSYTTLRNYIHIKIIASFLKKKKRRSGRMQLPDLPKRT
jgi:hypothetical protein